MADGTTSTTNRNMTIFGWIVIATSVVMAWWLVAIVGDLATAIWMVLVAATGVAFIAIGKRPTAEPTDVRRPNGN